MWFLYSATLGFGLFLVTWWVFTVPAFRDHPDTALVIACVGTTLFGAGMTIKAMVGPLREETFFYGMAVGILLALICLGIGFLNRKTVGEIPDEGGPSGEEG